MASDTSSVFDTDCLEASGIDVDRHNRGLEDWRQNDFLGPDPQHDNTYDYGSPGPSIWSPNGPQFSHDATADCRSCMGPRDLVSPFDDHGADFSHGYDPNDDQHEHTDYANRVFDCIDFPPDSTVEDPLAFDVPRNTWDQSTERQNIPPEVVSVGDSAIDLSQDKPTSATVEGRLDSGGRTQLINHWVNQDKPPRQNCREELRPRQGTRQAQIVIEQHKIPCTYPGCDAKLEKRGLNKHIDRVHNKKRDCLCEKCPKTFYSAKDLKDHQTSHKELREVVYLCPDRQCHRHKKGFTRQDNAYRHVRDKHKELLKQDADGKVVKGCVTFQTVPYQGLSSPTAAVVPPACR